MSVVRAGWRAPAAAGAGARAVGTQHETGGAAQVTTSKRAGTLQCLLCMHLQGILIFSLICHELTKLGCQQHEEIGINVYIYILLYHRLSAAGVQPVDHLSIVQNVVCSDLGLWNWFDRSLWCSSWSRMYVYFSHHVNRPKTPALVFLFGYQKHSS